MYSQNQNVLKTLFWLSVYHEFQSTAIPAQNNLVFISWPQNLRIQTLVLLVKQALYQSLSPELGFLNLRILPGPMSILCLNNFGASRSRAHSCRNHFVCRGNHDTLYIFRFPTRLLSLRQLHDQHSLGMRPVMGSQAK